MQLSKRLRAAAGLVTKGNRVADVGCDHAYTSIYLCEEGICPSVIAMDVNKGPLLRAEQNVAASGWKDRITLRLSDGLAELKEGEADTILLTGMGGLLMMKILTASPGVTASAKELVLQPQSEVAQVRRYLHKHGYRITGERMVREDEKFYVMLRAQAGEKAGAAIGTQTGEKACEPVKRYETEWQYAYGVCFESEDVPVVLEFLHREYHMKQSVLNGLCGKESEKAREREEELRQEITRILQATKYFEQSLAQTKQPKASAERRLRK